MILVVGIAFSAKSQNLVGLKKAEIIKIMKEKYPKFSLDQLTAKSSIASLKYIDIDNDKTLMYFFDDEGKCKYSKLVLDLDFYDHTIKFLNDSYTKDGDDKWMHKGDDKTSVINIDKNEWFFTVITTLKK